MKSGIMNRSIVNKDALISFSNDLKNYESEIQSIMSSIEKELNSFRWQDPQGISFHQSFDGLKKYVEYYILPIFKDYYNHLDNLARSVDEYNEQ